MYFSKLNKTDDVFIILKLSQILNQMGDYDNSLCVLDKNKKMDNNRNNNDNNGNNGIDIDIDNNLL